MKPEKSNRYKYADLLDNNSGPESERLMADLEKLFTTAEPPAYLADLQLSTLQEGAEKLRLSKPETAGLPNLPSGNGPFFMRPRFSLVKALTLSLVALALVGATIIVLVALYSDPRPVPAVGVPAGAPPTPVSGDKIDQIETNCKKQGLSDYDCLLKIYGTLPVWITQGRDLKLSQTSNGFTLTIRHVYADANAIFIGYDLKGPAGLYYSLGDFSLTDSQGQPLKSAGLGLGYQGAGIASFSLDNLNGDVKGQQIRNGTLKEVKVRFGVSQVSIRENPTPPSAPKLQANIPPIETPAMTLVMFANTPLPGTPPPPEKAIAIADLAGPNSFTLAPVTFNFDLTMPFSGGEIVFPALSTTASNRTVTLQKVVIAPSGTRMLLYNTDSTSMGFKATLAASNSPAIFANGQTFADQTELSFTENLMDKASGEWVLTYNEEKQQGMDCSFKDNAKICQIATPEAFKNTTPYPSGGPWVFRFNLSTAAASNADLPAPTPFPATVTPPAEVTATSGKCAGYTSLGCAFWASEFKAIQDGGLGQKVSLNQSANKLNLTVEKVYADANYIVIGYTVSGQDSTGLNFIPSGTATLVDSKGNKAVELGSQSVETIGGKRGVIVWFKNAGLTSDNDKALKLHLQDLRGQFVAPNSQLTPTTTKTSSGLQFGPFDFDLTIPVTSSRVAEINQKVVVGGTYMILERAVLTPVGLKLYLQKYVAKTPSRALAYEPGWNLNPILLSLNGKDLIGIPSKAQIDNVKLSADELAKQSQLEGTAEIDFFDTSLFMQQGQWSLLIREALDPKSAPSGTPASANSTGPWTFNFTIPQS